jgi:serine/threonine protein kinase
MIPFRASGEGRFLPGTLLGGRYRVIGLVGRGGMGEVYHATDLKLEQPVALKFLPEAQTADPAALERLSNEVRIARQVTHANVCRVYDIVEAEGFHYISMEYIDGEDLCSLLRRIGHVPADKALQMTRHLCVGLAAAHEKGIVPIGNLDLNENLEFAFPPSNLPSGTQRTSHVGCRRVCGLQISSHTPSGESRTTAPTRCAASFGEAA